MSVHSRYVVMIAKSPQNDVMGAGGAGGATAATTYVSSSSVHCKTAAADTYIIIIIIARVEPDDVALRLNVVIIRCFVKFD